MLQESIEGEIKLLRPGAAQALHPMAAVRFVMSVVHAAAAREDAATALEVEEAPPLEILLAACQIADCWDCPAVMAAAARCVKRAAAAESEPSRVASALVKLLRLVPLERDGSWKQLREAVEATIATVLPFFWIPSVLKAFDLESACRVIGLIEDLPIELNTLELKGATPLFKAWYDEANESIAKADLKSEAVPYPDARPTGGRKRAERRLGGNFHLTVSVVDANEKIISLWREKLAMTERMRASYAETGMVVPEFLETENADALEELRKAQLKQVAVHLHGDGCAVVLAKGSHLWLRPADSSKEKLVRQIVVTNETIEEEGYTFGAKLQCAEAFRLDGGMGWDNWGAAEELGGFRVGGTLVISKLQRQWQVLEAWQRLTGNKCEGSICPIVGSLHQLLLASRCVESRVRLHWQYRNFRSRGDVELSVQSVKPDAAPIGPAAERMCHTLMSLVVCRLDDENGSVNRAAALLPKECMMKILDVEMFKCFSGPKSERAILRLAVDWCSKAWRNQDDVLAVMRKVRLAGVPARTLMHLDEGSGRYAGNVTNHTLKNQLRELASSGIGDEDGNIEDLLIEALEVQKSGRHKEEEGLVRPCFEAPNFPDVRELYRLGYMSTLDDCIGRMTKERLCLLYTSPSPRD